MVEEFAKLGLRQKDLDNKETAQAIMEEIVVFQTVKEAAADPSATALRNTVKGLNLDIHQYAR